MVFKCFHVCFASVLAISDVCCICFHLDVVKVDRDVTHVASRRGKWAQVEAVPQPQVVPTCMREARRSRVVPTERHGWASSVAGQQPQA